MKKTGAQVRILSGLIEGLALMEVCKIWTLHIGKDMVHSTNVQPEVDQDNGFMSFGYAGWRKIYLSDISAVETTEFGSAGKMGAIYADKEADDES